ncbi:hypothetical protein SLA2020_166940 [Shorea laevis]
MGSSFRHDSSDASATATSFSMKEDNDEVELQWAAIERLPTFRQIRSSLFPKGGKEEREMEVIDVTKLGAPDRHVFIERLITRVEEDNLRLLKKLKERMERVGLELPTIEVRYQNLCVEAECEVVQGKPLPTLWNTIRGVFSAVTNVGRCNMQRINIKILKDVSGIIKPSRMTLLLGPPGCGKTTLLQALAGNLNPSLEVTGEITYNGYKLSEFVPQKTSAYVCQYDLHISEMTVRETLEFSAHCQGIGSRTDTMKEISRREKQLGVIPDPDIDTYMKATLVKGSKGTLQTDYILKILGLDTCADTIVGDAINRGISGGQKRRLTTGEMIIGPTKTLFMDEISNGLDTSTTFQIVTYLQQMAHITDATVIINVQEFFEHCGFKCPPCKGVADYLQEVISKKDQAQYWYHKDRPYSYVSIDKFRAAFKDFHGGQKLDEELCRPFNKNESHKSALSFNIYTLKKWELFKACMAREWLLMKRNSFIHIFKTGQLVVIALITTTVFLRTRMKVDMVHATYYMGSLFYALVRLMSNGIAELSFTVSRLPVFYKQRDLYFYPAWAYSIPAAILKIPFSLIDALLWTVLTYYGIGYSPEPQRFFKQALVLFLLNQVAISLFRVIASIARNPAVAATSGLFSLLVLYLFSGFAIPLESLPTWIKWGFWISPMAYAEIGISLNEFLAPRWQKVSSNETLGHLVLRKRGLNFNQNYYWISVAALIGFWIIFNTAFTFALSFLKPPGRSRATISRDRFSYLKAIEDSINANQEKEPQSTYPLKAVTETKTTGMVLPFEPKTLTFENVQYFVDTPKKLREQGFLQKRLQLLQDITGTFRPGILTALMGVSGAGKTTLMDVLCGRKTGGYIEGEIKIGGYPKVQETFARISGYCEQTDIHSPQLTIEESVMYSAWLRLPMQLDKHKRLDFVAEVLQMIELDGIKDSLVGIPGLSGLSPEQRKRLTIAVELISNPSIIFMDEPTSGLDARAAAIVMRVVKNIAQTNRTIVCTIHQPSIDIFEAFDELILMKRGGRIIYYGELGQHSNKLVEYFEGIPGVPKIKENYNPATWMLEVTNPSAEAQLQVDFASLYKESHLYRRNEELVKELSLPADASEELCFPTRFPQNGWEQFKACFWKQHLSYWRSPAYNLARLSVVTAASLLYGVLLWQKGQKIGTEQDLFNIMGSVYIFMIIIGVSGCSSVMPFVGTQRTVFYRERFAGMYSSWAYSLSQVIIEIPYIFLEAVLFSMITYPAVSFYKSAYKVFWYLYAMFCTLLYFKYLGMMLVSLTATSQVAAIFASFSYTLLSLFSGYLIPEPQIPKWWVWAYWICPSSWSLKGIIASQYADVNKVITAFGEQKTISAFLENQQGYKHQDLPIIAIVLLAFPLFFASIFAYCISKLNFQRR